VKGYVVKVVVIGGTGLIGSKLVAKLREHGHEAVPAVPNTGVNTLTGEGLAEVLKGAAVVVDVSNSPSFADDAVLAFFRTSTTNLLEYSAKAGVGHYWRCRWSARTGCRSRATSARRSPKSS
jgi:uncharacterized protein YbjT (DUF2867 family)